MKRLREQPDSQDALEQRAATMLRAFDEVADDAIERARVRARLSEALRRPRRILGFRPMTVALVLGGAGAAAAALVTYQLTGSDPAPWVTGAASRSATAALREGDRSAGSSEPVAPAAPPRRGPQGRAAPATPPPIVDDEAKAATPAPQGSRDLRAAREDEPEPREEASAAEPARETAQAPHARHAPSATAAAAAPAPTPAAEVERPITPSPPPVPPAPSPAATTPSAAPEEEARFVAAALRALRVERKAALASDLLKVYLRRFPNGVLAEEALALAMEAAVAQADARAVELARRYLRRFPQGRFREQAERVHRNLVEEP